MTVITSDLLEGIAEDLRNLPPLPGKVLVGTAVVYEEDLVFHVHTKEIEAPDLDHAYSQAFEFVVESGIQHASRFLDEASLDGISFEDLRALLLEYGVHLGFPVLQPVAVQTSDTEPVEA